MDDSTAQFFFLVNGTDINLCEETRVSPLHIACKIEHEFCKIITEEWCRYQFV